MEKINNKITVSKHGEQRILERTHCKKKDIENFLTKVWCSGKKIESYDHKTRIFSYLTNVKNGDGDNRSLRVHGNTVYIFNKNGSVLITCYDIPQGVIQNKSTLRSKRKKLWQARNLIN